MIGTAYIRGFKTTSNAHTSGEDSMAAESLSFSSKIFKIDTVQMSDRTEQIVKGGRHLFPLLLQGVRGRQADRRHRLGLAGSGAGAEPA